MLTRHTLPAPDMPINAVMVPGSSHPGPKLAFILLPVVAGSLARNVVQESAILSPDLDVETQIFPRKPLLCRLDGRTGPRRGMLQHRITGVRILRRCLFFIR